MAECAPALKSRAPAAQNKQTNVTMTELPVALKTLLVAFSTLSSSLAFHTSHNWCFSKSKALYADAFSSSPLPFHPASRWNLPRSTTALYAKATRKKNKKKKASPSVSSSGGFGKSVPAVQTKQDDDYAAFPALEPQVQETIVAYQGDVTEQGQELPNEMYERLDQIYGFHNFNYLTEETEATSLGDLLAAPGAEEPISEMSDLLKPSAPTDLSGLFGTPSNTDSPATSTDLPCLSSLPPFSEFHVLHADPLVISIDNFFTDEECDRYVAMSEAPASKSASAPEMTRSKTVGKDANAKAQRTSTTWFHHFKEVPELMAKASRLLGLDGIDHWEEPQTVRYRRNEKFTWHLDALAPSDDLESLGGQRTATMLVYLTELTDDDGGATVFRDLKGADGTLRVRPKKGSALLFFPAAGGIPNVPFDIRTLHCGEVVAENASQDKWIAQLWLRKNGSYKPSAPKGNSHADAAEAIEEYCTR